MRRAALVLLALLAALPSAAAGGAPRRVMSMNLCTDQLVLALLPPARIASVTWLARDPESSLMAARARRVGVNHGVVEEVLRQHPDLVVASSFTTPAATGLLKRLGYPLLQLDEAASFADVRRVTRQLAAALDVRARGEALIARMDRQLADLARDPGPPIRVAAWDGGGFNARAGSLYDAVLRAAGAVNVAADPRVAGHGAPDAELLLATAPALLVQGAPGFRRRGGLGDDVARHPLVRRLWRGRTLVIRPAYYDCGTPFAADAAIALRTELRAAAARAARR